METRASYIAVGAFVLVLILGLVGFVVWVGKFRGAEEFARYDILFAGSVTGLQVDGTVRYRGIPVGRIIEIRIDPGNIEKVRVTVEVKADTPVRTDTEASIELQGITGVTYVLLKGGKQDSPALPITMKAPYPEIKSIPSKLEKLFESAPDLLSKATNLIDRVTLLFSDENEENISATLANLRALSDRFSKGGGNLDAMLESGKSALAKIDSMSTELEGLAKDLRSQLNTPGTEGRTTVADILGNANTAIQQLQKTGGEFEQLAHDVRGQLSTPGPAGSPTVADLLREGTVTLQRIQTVGTDFQGLVGDLRKQMEPGAEGRATVADVLARGAVTIDQLNKTGVEFEQLAHNLRVQLTAPGAEGGATVADLVQQGKATLERIQGMSTEFETLARSLRTDLALGEQGQSKVAGLVDNASTAAANIGRMSAEIEGLAKDLRGEFSNMEGKHGERISGLLTQATLAAEQITSMSKEFELLAKDLRTDAAPLVGKASTAFANMQDAMAQFGETSKSFAAVADQLEATVKENREPLRDFSSTGLNELTLFLNEARQLVASMTRISSQIERDPARFFLGDRREGFQAQ